jgi:hypothetical protein
METDSDVQKYNSLAVLKLTKSRSLTLAHWALRQ